MKLGRLVLGVLIGVVGLSACSTGNSPKSSELPGTVAEVGIGESIGLKDLFGDGWTVAYVDYCPGNSVKVQNRVVDVSFVPCSDPDFGRANLVLFGRSGEVIRWFEQTLPTAVLYGCFTPKATWTRDPNGFSSDAGAEGSESCVPVRED